jgi:ABC-type transport system involved in cytochrome c biogenesis permease subunit
MTISSVLILYGISGIGFITYLFLRKESLRIPLNILFGITILCHMAYTVSLWRFQGELPVTSPAQAINMVTLFSSLVFVPIALKKNSAILTAFFLPVATFMLSSIASLIQPGQAISLGSHQFWYTLHTLSVTLGEALFVVATISSAVYLIHERIIRKGSIHTALSALPPLSLLDSILYVSLSAGFIAISIGMIMGGLWASVLGISFSNIAPKVLAGALMWFIYALGLHQRFAIGWKGRRTAVITLIGFIIMVLLFIGINSMFPNAHGIRLM